MLLRRIIIPAIIGIAMPFVLVSAVSAAVKHTVGPGETLGFIALMYDTTVDELTSLNSIADPDLIFPGQELLVDDGGGSAAGWHVVEAGDTLSSIAFAYGVSVDDLAAANRLTNYDLIYIGQTLTIPSEPGIPKLAFPPRPENALVESVIEDLAAQEGVPVSLVKAIATVESGWNQWAISSAGAIGVMQVMPGTVWWLENSVFGYDLYEYDSIYDNVKLGVRYIRILLAATGGDWYNTAAAYYQGLTPTQQGVYYADTTDYASMVLSVAYAYWS